MVRVIFIVIEIIICFLLQTSVFSYIPFSSVVPNCLLVLVICVAYTKGQNKAILLGFVSGFLIDLMASGTIGICAIIYMFIAFLAGYTNKIYDRHDYIIPGGLILIGEFLYSFLYYCTGFMLMGKLNLGGYMINTIIPRIIYTLVSAIIVFPMYVFFEWAAARIEGSRINE